MAKSQISAELKKPLELNSSLKIIAELISSDKMTPDDVKNVLSQILKASEDELSTMWSAGEKKRFLLFGKKENIPKNISATSAQYFAHVANSYKAHANNINRLMSQQVLTADKLSNTPSKTLAKLSVKDVVSEADMAAITDELRSLADILEDEGLKFEGDKKIQEYLKLIETSDRMSEKELTAHIHSLLDTFLGGVKKLKEPFKSAFDPLVPASQLFVSKTVGRGEAAEFNAGEFVRFVRNVGSILATSYFLNRMIWMAVTAQAKRGNYELVNIFVRTLNMFPEKPMDRWNAQDTPTILWGYFLCIVFMTLVALVWRWYLLNSKNR